MRELFGLDPGLVFLNHGSYGACPRPVREAQRAWQDEMERNPVAFLGRRSAALLRTAREALATFVGAQADHLVFVPNATTGVNIVARSLDLRPGDEVLGTTLEYGACDATWQFVCAQQGASYRRAPIALPLDDAAFVDAVMAAVTPRTRLIFVSHIASTTALVLPVAALVDAAHARGLQVLVDGAHAPGQIELDLDALGADFYTGNGHKWLCGPKGVAFLHARPEHHERLHATVISWGYVAGSGGHTGFDAYTGRSTFERRLQWQGTRDITGCLALTAAIDFHRTHLSPEVRAACHHQAVALMHEMAGRFGLPVIGSDAHFAQMAAVPVPGCDAEALRARLFDRHRIEVPVTRHEGRTFVRVSVQGYNTRAELEALATALAEAFADG
jgi:isopenicillin-N epimerase